MKVSKLGRHHCERVSRTSQSVGSEVVVVVVEWEREPVGARRSFRRALRPAISSVSWGT